MRRSVCVLIVLLTVLSVVLPTAAQDSESTDNPLLRMLEFVPDTPENRAFIQYGDLAAWYESWSVPRVVDVDALESLDERNHAAWMFIMPRQTTPPEVLGLRHLFTADQNAAFGFSLFTADRFLQAGEPPEWFTVIEQTTDADEISAALEASGYSATTIDEGTVYSFGDDYQVHLQSDLPRVAQLGDLNRIALLDAQIVTAKASGVLESVLDARSEDAPSLADNAAFRAAASALLDPSLDETGDLVGAILMDSAMLMNPTSIPTSLTPEQRTAIMAAFGDEDSAIPLPAYTAAAFGVRHTEGKSSYILALVFPDGVEADEAARTLEKRMRGYTSVMTRRSFSDMLEDRNMTFDIVTGIEADGLPVALVVLSHPDPSLEGNPPQVYVFSWYDMIVARDTLFLGVLPQEHD